MSINVRTLIKILPAMLLTVPTVGFAGNAIEADLAATYSPSAADSFGGEDNIQLVFANSVAGNNLFNDQSGTGAHMRIAGYYMSPNDPVNEDNGAVVSWVAGYSSNPNYDFSDVRDFGTSVGADLVLWVSPNTGAAGNAYQPGMYSCISASQLWSGVLAHETGGHNYGRAHGDGVLNPKTIMMHNYCGGGAAPPYFYSNPNIWFNGVRLLGPGINEWNCTSGSLINGGDNASCSAQAVADHRIRVSAGPNLNHVVLHWSFTNAPGYAVPGSTNYDSVSGAPAIVRGNGALYTGEGLRLPGTTTGNVAANAMSAYIDLPNGILSSRTNITIEIWVTPLSAKNWGRVCDFGRPTQAGDGLGAAGEYTGTPGTAAPGTTSASDDIMLSFSVGTDLNKQRFESLLNGANKVSLDSGLATTAGVQHHYALTFTDGAGSSGSSGGRWQWYRDGDAVAYLDVAHHLSVIEDVNNWLGRSMWTADNNANATYAEVRVSDVALSRDELLANYLLGPNHVPSATVTLTDGDAYGTTSFNTAGHWSNGAAPGTGDSYETYGFQLRTPPTSGSFTFGGDALQVSGGAVLWKGSRSGLLAINNLTLNGGSVNNAGSGTCTLSGSLNVTTNGGTINAVNGPINITAPFSGDGQITFLANSVTLYGDNGAFSGKMAIGNGQPGTLVLNSPARLGASPAVFTSDQLTLNRGTLQTTATMALDDPNRGILLDVSGGQFNVNAGTTLTLASRLSSPSTAANIVVGSLTKTGGGTLILDSPGATFRGTLYVDTGVGSGNEGVVRVANSQVLAGAHSPIFIRNVNAAASTLQLDGTAGNVVLSQSFAVNGRSTATAAIQNVAGTNALNGSIEFNDGGSLFTLQSDAGQLIVNGTQQYVGSAVGVRTHNFTGAGDILVNGAILNANNGSTVNLIKSGTGTLTLAGVNTFGGVATVSAGALVVNGSVGGSAMNVYGLLGGSGTVAGPVSIQSGGTLSPGASIGTLTINDTLSLAANSTTLMEISKAGAVLSNDSVKGLSSVSFGGSLVVTNVDSTSLSAGDAFQLFAAAAYDQDFASVSLPPLDSGLVWTNRLAVDGTIAVVNAVSLEPTDLGWNADGSNLTLTWPDDHTGWRLQAQTNPLSAGLGTNWYDVLGSSDTNRMILPLDVTNGSVFYRLISP